VTNYKKIKAYVFATMLACVFEWNCFCCCCQLHMLSQGCHKATWISQTWLFALCRQLYPNYKVRIGCSNTPSSPQLYFFDQIEWNCFKSTPGRTRRWRRRRRCRTCRIRRRCPARTSPSGRAALPSWSRTWGHFLRNNWMTNWNTAISVCVILL
jgi:hypothetical protein